MIIYQENVGTFINQCNKNIIEKMVLDALKANSIGGGSSSEQKSWANSLPRMGKVLDDEEIDKSLDVAIEYKLLSTKQRVDFLIYGKNNLDKESVIIVELKQWSSVKPSNLKNHVFTEGGGGLDDYWHPSYQAFNYASILRSFNEYAYTNQVDFRACSYLHNMGFGGKILLNDEKKYPLINEAPAFVKEDDIKLREFIKKYVSKPYKMTLYEIDNSRIRPSVEFANMLANAINGNPFFTYDEQQAYSVEKIVSEVKLAKQKNIRKTIIVKGGPGTGKTVVGVNVLGQLIHPQGGNERFNAVISTFSFTPRQYATDILVDNDYTKRAIGELFKKPSVFTRSSALEFDCVIIDEAHRAFEWKFGLGIKRDVDIIDAVFNASRVNVFFIDEDQAVTTADSLTIDKIKKYAAKYGSQVIESDNLTLTSQFRCLGGEDYIEFINYFLGYKDKAMSIKNIKYDFKIFDNPEDMVAAIAKKNSGDSKDSRLISGYTHDWVSEDDSSKFDFDYPNCKLKWNKTKSDSTAIKDETQLDRVFVVHTVQGVDLEYAGVIIGKDLRYDALSQKIIFDKSQIANTDHSGIRTAPNDKAERLIRNIYKVLLTRGMKGTYVYCEDKALSDYLKMLKLL